MPSFVLVMRLDGVREVGESLMSLSDEEIETDFFKGFQLHDINSNQFGAE